MGNGVWLSPLVRSDEDRARLVDYRLTWRENLPPRACPVRLSADCRYKLWCNGAFVSFGPAKGDGKVWYYDALDLAPWLRAGINVLAVQVLHYPAVRRSEPT